MEVQTKRLFAECCRDKRKQKVVLWYSSQFSRVKHLAFGIPNSCLAYILAQTYACFFIPSKDFLKFLPLLSPPPSSCPKRGNSFSDTLAPVWKPETLTNAHFQQEGWVVSCSNSHSSSSVHFTLEASSLLLFAHYPKKVADQAAQLRGELWAGCFIPTPTARSVWLMPRDELLSPGCTGYGGSLDGWLKCSASLCEGQTLTHLVLQRQSQALNGAVWT